MLRQKHFLDLFDTLWNGRIAFLELVRAHQMEAREEAKRRAEAERRKLKELQALARWKLYHVCYGWNFGKCSILADGHQSINSIEICTPMDSDYGMDDHTISSSTLVLTIDMCSLL